MYLFQCLRVPFCYIYEPIWQLYLDSPHFAGSWFSAIISGSSEYSSSSPSSSFFSSAFASFPPFPSSTSGLSYSGTEFAISTVSVVGFYSASAGTSASISFSAASKPSSCLRTSFYSSGSASPSLGGLGLSETFPAAEAGLGA